LAPGALDAARGVSVGGKMIGKLGLPEVLILLAIALLLFGPSKLADLGKGLGEGIRNFKSAVTDSKSDAEKK
jgi:sec-independent protein translocase protein TatA